MITSCKIKTAVLLTAYLVIKPCETSVTGILILNLFGVKLENIPQETKTKISM